MRHEIETCGTPKVGRDREVLQNIGNAVSEEHPTFTFQLVDDPWRIKVLAHCNGAALRDLVDMLDRAGFLS